MDDEEYVAPKPPEVTLRRPKKIVIPRRVPSIVTPEPDATRVAAHKETDSGLPRDVYGVPERLIPCQKSPLTLYELAAVVVDIQPVPIAFSWSEEEVADWMSDILGLPAYRVCIFKNNVNGLRLIMLEDPSHLQQMNIRNFDHIRIIVQNVRKLFTLEFILFARSIGLPPRKPLSHCTWFKSRTGPSWGIRKNWTRCDILRRMKIITPVPVYRDHWDLVWYRKPEFPKVMFARISKPALESVPQYKPLDRDACREYLAPRRFRLQVGIPEEAQLIWMERPAPPPETKVDAEKKRKRVRLVPKDSRLYPKKVNLTGLRGIDLVLARRKMFKQKFLNHF